MATRARHLRRLLPAAAGAALGLHPIVEADTFWHVVLGRAVLRHGSRVVPEPLAFEAWSLPCVVAEWLWDVFTYAVYTATGEHGLSLLTVLFGGIAGWLVGWLVDVLIAQYEAPRAQPMGSALGVLSVCALAEQLNVRPNLAFSAALTAFLALLYRYRAPAVPSAKTGAALIALAVLWAQVHGSFVLAPALLLIVVAPVRIARRARLRLDLIVLLGLLLAALTCAHGVELVDYVLSHAGGDATRHIVDMRPFDWRRLAPLGWPLGAVIWMLLLTGACAPLLGQRIDPSAALLALLGAAMAHTADRFAVQWTVLLLPWAIGGACALAGAHGERMRPLRNVQLGYGALALVVLAWTFARVDEQFGPWGRTGLAAGMHPEASARYLARVPRGTPVLTSYQAGPLLGLRLDGRVRTFVDGRTPVYFDAADWAVARDMYTNQRALELGLRHHRVRAAVVERTSPACDGLARLWTPALIEAKHTLFVPGDAASGLLTGLEPCGPLHLARDACADGGTAVLSAVERLASVARTPFTSYLAAAAGAQCRRGEPDALLRRLPDEQDARLYLQPYRLYRSLLLLRMGDADAALSTLDDALDADQPLAVNALLDEAAGVLPAAEAQRLLERGIAQMDDNAPPALRARLALICAARGNAECARFHGLRALLSGADEALPAVRFAARRHPQPHVRADLARWAAELSPRPTAAAAP